MLSLIGLVALATPQVTPATPVVTVPLTTLKESARYRVTYGLLGELGQITISVAPGAAGGTSPGVRATGFGAGSLLGIGPIEKRVESELDARAAETRRWTTTKSQGSTTTTDSVEQPTPGAVALVRRRTGEPDRPESFRRQRPVLDPVGFLLHLRVAPPTADETFEVLDGRALWLMTVQAAKPDGQALRLDGRADPIYWNGNPDSERPVRSFSLWLANDPYRTPVRMVMPLGIGEVLVELASVDRSPTRRLSFFGRTFLARFGKLPRALQ